MDEDVQIAAEEMRAHEPAGPDDVVGQSAEVRIPAGALLRFIDRNTNRAPRDLADIDAPASEQCDAADKMMQATDTDLRAMIMSETLGSV